MSRLVGPALGGALVTVTGVASCFYVNAVSFVVVLGALASIDRNRLVPRPHGDRATGNLRAAVAYVRHHPDVRRPLIVMAVVGLVVLNFQTTFPAMVRFGFDRGPGAVGMAMSVSAIGSILGGIYAAGIAPDPRRTLARVLVGFSTMLVVGDGAELPDLRRPRHSLACAGVLPIGEHRRGATGHGTSDAGTRDGASPDGVERKHATRSAGGRLDHPDLISPDAVPARWTRRDDVCGRHVPTCTTVARKNARGLPTSSRREWRCPDTTEPTRVVELALPTPCVSNG
ncbi:MAG: MFS transporter [Ilumatobacteraceae bacterium]